jgi:hypothetical protein
MKNGFKKLKFTLALSLFPIKPLLEKIGIHYDLVKMGNDFYREDFYRAETRDCAVILPHCLIHEDCPATFSKVEGIICIECGLCRCGEIKALCEERGLRFFITPSVGFTKRLAERKRIKAALGATCDFEIERGLRTTRITLRGVHLNKNRVIPQAIMTSKYDCLDNDVDWDLLKEFILSRKE